MSVLMFLLLQLFSMIKSEEGIKRRGDFFWSVGDFSFEKDTIGHIFTGQYYGLHVQAGWCMSEIKLHNEENNNLEYINQL